MDATGSTNYHDRGDCVVPTPQHSFSRVYRAGVADYP